MTHHGVTTDGYSFSVQQSGPVYFEISMQRNDIIVHETYEENPPREDKINALIQEMSARLKALSEEETKPYVKKELPPASSHIDIIESSSARP